MQLITRTEYCRRLARSIFSPEMELNDPAVVLATGPPITDSVRIKSIKVCIIFPNYGGAVFLTNWNYLYIF